MKINHAKTGTIIGIIGLILAIVPLISKKTARLEGEWQMTNTIQKANLSKYRGMTIKWILQLTQNGENITGTGEKIAVNGKKLKFHDRNMMEIIGTIDGDKFNLRFIEKGKLRETVGIMKGEISKNKFTGIVSQTASDSRGNIIGEKVIHTK